ncbi:hypothetical protein ABT127_35520 [Streptomyces sp. NPDC001904]|uniref:hypothetical protein n=1 Tax=Streptomyces sp. NPDC001904 TaxID=3154531 RepID=UPI003322803A
MRRGVGRRLRRLWTWRGRERATVTGIEDEVPEKGALDVAVRLTKSPGPAAPTRATRTQVSGDGGSVEKPHRLAMPSYRPAVMVFSTDARTQVHVRFENRRRERSSRLYRLSGDGTPVTARIPLPEKGRATAFRVFTAGERAPWTATAAPLREVPRFHDEISGTGSDVVHFRGGPGPGVLHYAGPGLVQLEALDSGLAYRVTVAEARTGEHTFQWPASGYYQVRSAGAWSLTATAGPAAREIGGGSGVR